MQPGEAEPGEAEPGEGNWAAWILEHTSAAHAVLAPDGTIIFANPAFCRVSGREDMSVLGSRFHDFLPTGARMYYETHFIPTLLAQGVMTEVSMEIVTGDARRVPVFLNAVVTLGPDGTPRRILLTLFEATQRKRYETDLLRAKRDLEQVAEVVLRSSDAILSLAADGKIQSWNRGAEQIFGLAAAEALGLSFLTIFTEEHRDNLAAAIGGLDRGAEVSMEMHTLRNDGRLVEVAVNLTPHMEAPGTLVAFSAVIRDSTLRKQTEKALIQNEKLASVGRLASSIAHEINNPLEAVTNLLYILQSRVIEPETKAFVTLAQEELARVSQIATHTLRFHKQSGGQTPVDLATLTQSVFALYRARLENQSIEAVNDSSRASRLFCFDGEMRQIFANLVSNAFDAMRGGGRLIVRSRDTVLYPSQVKGVRITVADTGTGMDPSVLAHIFEPFFSTKGIGGTGLGMWITHDLVLKNKGSIRIRSSSRAPGNGTVISMTFPHADPVA